MLAACAQHLLHAHTPVHSTSRTALRGILQHLVRRAWYGKHGDICALAAVPRMRA